MVFLLIETCFIWRLQGTGFLDIRQIMRSSKGYQKYLTVVQQMFWIIFCFVLFIKSWPYLKITKGWHFRYILHMVALQITQIRQVTLHKWWIVANVLNQFLNFVLWHTSLQLMEPTRLQLGTGKWKFCHFGVEETWF